MVENELVYFTMKLDEEITPAALTRQALAMRKLYTGFYLMACNRKSDLKDYIDKKAVQYEEETGLTVFFPKQTKREG